MGTHSIIAPSSAGIWAPESGCLGYVSMMQQLPELADTETEESREGDAAHELAAFLTSTLLEHNRLVPSGEVVGGRAGNGVIFDDAMYDAAELYARSIWQEVAAMQAPDLVWKVEAPVHAGMVHALSYGTTDFYAYSRQRRKLVVVDFKYGRRHVPAFESWQVINYFAGVCEAHDINGAEDQTLQTKLRIIQPRGYSKGGPVDDWDVLASDLRPYVNQLARRAAMAVDGGHPVQSGPQCHDCPAKLKCEASLLAGPALYEAAAQAVPVALTPEALGVYLSVIRRGLQHLKDLDDSITAEIDAMSRAGQSVPGWELQPTYGREKWAIPVNDVIKLGLLFGQDVAKPGTITPKQAIALGLPADTVRKYTEQNRNGVKLTQDDGSNAKKVFTQRQP